MYLLLLIYFSLFTFLVWRDIKWGIFLITAFLPSYLIRFSLGPLPLTVLEGMILITFVLWLCHSERNEESLSLFKRSFGRWPQDDTKKTWLIAIGLFLLAATISVFVSPNPREALGIWKAYFIEPALFFLVITTTIKTTRDKEKIFWALSLGALPVALLAVIQHFTGWLIPNPYWAAEATRRVTSVFGYPNAVALYLAPIIPLSFYLLIKAINKKQVYSILYLVFSILFFLLAIIFAKSTGALIAISATGVLAGLYYKKTRYFAVSLVFLALILIPLTPLKQPVGEEVLMRGRSGLIRLNMWGETVEMLRTHPILGAGLAGYQIAVEPYHILSWAEIYLYPHNLFLNFWTETGLLGLVGFILLVWVFFKTGYQKIKKEPLIFALLSAMLIILIHSLVDVPYFKNDLAVVFWLLLGLVIT